MLSNPAEFAATAAKSLQSCLTLCYPMPVAHQAPLMECSRQEYWSTLPFPPPGDLLDPGIKLASPALAGGFVSTKRPGTP